MLTRPKVYDGVSSLALPPVIDLVVAKLTELLPGDSACEEAWGGDQPQLLRAGLGQAGGRGGSGQPQEGSGQPQETEGRYSALGQVREKSMFWSKFP